jgi:TetR/AcrR family transcriptional regulator, transcriptional repressor for nem operon
MTNSLATKKAQTRSRILDSAKKLLFQGGFNKTSVAKLMKNAGFTVGGFYAHFPSKDALLLDCFRNMLSETIDQIANIRGDEAEKKRVFRNFYLSQKHRDQPESGCPVPSFLFETSQKNKEFRQEFAQILEQSLKERRELLSIQPEEEDVLLAEFCQWIGAQMLARATVGTTFSDRILESCNKKEQ